MQNFFKARFRFIFFVRVVLICNVTTAQLPPLKQSILNSIESHQSDLVRLSDQIWAFAETALREHQSAKALADYAAQQGFKVERGVAGLPTAFIASYGTGEPIIGILGEFDALPGLSQKATPERAPLQAGAAGHGCGHNMFGPASLGAAIAVKELMQQGKLKGTVRFYGTPAEEDYAGKVYMARAGLFNDLDVCLDWHPGDGIEAGTQSSQAVVDYSIEFFGKPAHAAYDPWNGRSASDAVELCVQGINYLREHIKPSVRIHYTIQKAGDVPNVVAEYGKLWVWVRDSKRTGVAEVWNRIEKIAQGAALMADVQYKLTLNSGLHEILVNRTGAKVLQKNLELLGGIAYTAEELEFARQVQGNFGAPFEGIDGIVRPLKETETDPQGGSTDVGDVSWITPEISLVAPTAPKNAPWHSWVVVACGGMSIGHKGMLYAAKALGLTMVDLFENEAIRKDMRKEFLERKGDYIYTPWLPAGPPPVVDK